MNITTKLSICSKALFGTVSLLLTLPSSANEHAHNTQTAHVHGVAELQIAHIGNKLEIRFESPSANLLGFEHKAETHEEKQRAADVDRVLKSPQILFGFQGSECKLSTLDVGFSSISEPVIDEHEHEHEHEHEKNITYTTHSDITAEYSFLCSTEESLNEISVDLLDQFPAVETLNVNWILSTGQGSTQLSADNKSVKLTH